MMQNMGSYNQGQPMNMGGGYPAMQGQPMVGGPGQ